MMNKNIKVFSLLLALLMLVGCSSQKKAEKKLPKFELDESAYKMSEKLEDFTLALNGKVLKFPLSYGEFQKSGWALTKENQNKTLEPRQYGAFEIELEGKKMGAYFVNFEDETAAISDSVVCGAVLEENDESLIELPKGIKLSESDKKSARKAFGKPSSETTNKLTYSFSEEKSVVLTFKDDKLYKIDAKYVADPRYFGASSEVPEIVKDYKAPKELSTSLSDFTFYLYGKTYTMPLPVSVLIENGWILASKTEEYILPGEVFEGAVKLTTLNRTITFDVKNLADYPTTAENCFITEIESKYDFKLDMVLGVSWVRVGGSESSLVNTFGEKNFSDIKKTKKKTEYIYEDPEKGKIVVTAKEGYISRISVSLKEE